MMLLPKRSVRSTYVVGRADVVCPHSVSNLIHERAVAIAVELARRRRYHATTERLRIHSPLLEETVRQLQCVGGSGVVNQLACDLIANQLTNYYLPHSDSPSLRLPQTGCSSFVAHFLSSQSVKAYLVAKRESLLSFFLLTVSASTTRSSIFKKTRTRNGIFGPFFLKLAFQSPNLPGEFCTETTQLTPSLSHCP